MTTKQKEQIVKAGYNTRFQKGHKDIVPKEARQRQGKKILGNKNGIWKGGIRKSSGYVWILQPNHLKVVDKYVKKAILVMEKKIGRLLTKEEVVHHINEIKNDDRPENLYLFSNGNKHKTYHLRVMATYKKWTGLKIKVLERIKKLSGTNFGYFSIPAFWRNEADENGYCGGMIEPIDEEQERKLVEQAEIAREIDRDNMRFLNAQFRL